MKKLLIKLLSLALHLNLTGQDIPTGTWRNHFDFSSTSHVVASQDHVFCASTYGLFYIDLQSNEIGYLNKQAGLGDVGVTALTYDFDRETLIVGYSSGTIDLVGRDEITSITTLRDVEIQDSKKIQDFAFADNGLYAATDLGVVRIDLEQKEARDVYRDIGPDGSTISATALELLGDSLFVVTDLGIMSGDINENLLDYSKWYLFESSDTLNGKDFYISGDEVVLFGLGAYSFIRENQSWNPYQELPEPIHSTLSTDNEIYAVTDHMILDLTNSVEILERNLFEEGHSIEQIGNEFWIADGAQGLLQIQMGTTNNFSPPGPKSPIYKMVTLENELWAFHAPRPEVTQQDTAINFISRFDGTWKIEHLPQLNSISSASLFQGDILLSTYKSGLYNFSQGRQLEEVDKDWVITDLAQIDDQLWLSVYDNSLSLHAIDPFGGLNSYSSALIGTRYPLELTSSLGNVIWIRRGVLDGSGFVAFEPSNEYVRRITTSDGIPSNQAFVTIDHDDEGWVGSPAGLVIFPDATFVFDNNPPFTPYFEGFPLLENEIITAIEFDGGNRRWIGTTSGLWVFDEQLSVLLERFTINSSPMPSNVVKALAYQGATGEMFVLTDQGLVSYQTDSSEPRPKHTDVKIYPNPIQSNSDIPLTITGLVSNAQVKITDIEGHIVQDLRANGSALSWNLRSFSGQRIQAGIYLVFSSDEEGSETFIGKFAVLP